MSSFLLRLRHPRRQSTWRGAAGGLLAHYAAAAILLTLLAVLKPFIWTALFGSPLWQSTGPINPSSGEGTLLQIVGLLSWVPGGMAAIHWGGTSRWRSVLVLLAYLAAVSLLAIVSGEIQPMSPERAAWYWLSAPLGLALGAVTCHKRSGVTASRAATHVER